MICCKRSQPKHANRKLQKFQKEFTISKLGLKLKLGLKIMVGLLIELTNLKKAMLFKRAKVAITQDRTKNPNLEKKPKPKQGRGKGRQLIIGQL